ncbi:STN domain-containing protein, partial [Salmonella enterica]|uniref:STN domain-containing protein n=1 Tax=Salmonella enterica TaxID=28901 RepID=UPI003D2B3E2E
ELRQFAIPAQPAETAIGILGHQANVQIIASRNLTHAVRTNEVRGRLTVGDALDRLLAGTGLAARQTGPATFAVVGRPLAARGPLTSP